MNEENKWTTRFSDGVTIKQEEGKQSCSFDFPASVSIHCLTRKQQGKGSNLELKFKLEGTAEFIALAGGPFAAAHLFFEGTSPTNNWLATWTQSIELQNVVGKGIQTVKIPLTPEYWVNAVNQPANSNKDLFLKTIKEIKAVGLTFGGRDADWDNGVKIKTGGKATFTLISLNITK